MEIAESPLKAYLAWFRSQASDVRASIASQMIKHAPGDALGVVHDGATDNEVEATFLTHVEKEPSVERQMGMMLLLRSLTKFVVEPVWNAIRRDETMAPGDWRHEALENAGVVAHPETLDASEIHELHQIKCEADWALLEGTAFDRFHIESWHDGQTALPLFLADARSMFEEQQTRTLKNGRVVSHLIAPRFRVMVAGAERHDLACPTCARVHREHVSVQFVPCACGATLVVERERPDVTFDEARERGERISA